MERIYWEWDSTESAALNYFAMLLVSLNRLDLLSGEQAHEDFGFKVTRKFCDLYGKTLLFTEE